MTDMDMNEMLDAIGKACERKLPASDPGYTVEELRAHWSATGKHMGIGAARDRVKAALQNGMLVIGKRWRIDAAGRCVSEQVYRPA